jgi:hypothetical protein
MLGMPCSSPAPPIAARIQDVVEAVRYVQTCTAPSDRLLLYWSAAQAVRTSQFSALECHGPCA